MASQLKLHTGVYQRGPRWYYQITINGRRHAKSAPDYKSACEGYDKIKREGLPVRAETVVLYSELVKDALAHSEVYSRDTLNFASRCSAADAEFGHLPANSITPILIRTWIDSHHLWCGATKNRMKAAMSTVYRLAMDNGKATSNPARLVKTWQESPGRLRYLSVEEAARIRQVLAAHANRANYIPQFEFSLLTGLRMSEQFRLKFSDIDFARKQIYLGQTKNGSSRYVHLSEQAVQILKDLQATHARLGLGSNATIWLSHQGKPMLNPKNWFEVVCREAGVEGVTWHTLRHTFASWLTERGCVLPVVSKLMGHSSLIMTQRYAHLSPVTLSASLELLSAALPINSVVLSDGVLAAA